MQFVTGTLLVFKSVWVRLFEPHTLAARSIVAGAADVVEVGGTSIINRAELFVGALLALANDGRRSLLLECHMLSATTLSSCRHQGRGRCLRCHMRAVMMLVSVAGRIQ